MKTNKDRKLKFAIKYCATEEGNKTDTNEKEKI